MLDPSSGQHFDRLLHFVETIYVPLVHLGSLSGFNQFTSSLILFLLLFLPCLHG
jgi:hypothetical protein